MRMALSFLLIAFLIFFMPVPAGSQGTATQVETPPPPAGVFNLTLQQTLRSSATATSRSSGGRRTPN